MTIQLIGFEGSSYALKVVATLNELGLPYEFVKVTKIEDVRTPEFLAKNPLYALLFFFLENICAKYNQLIYVSFFLQR